MKRSKTAAPRTLETAPGAGETSRDSLKSNRSAELLQAILDNTTAVIYVKDCEGRYLLINHRYEQLFHTTQMEIQGKTDFDIFPESTARTFRENDLRVLEGGTPLEVEELAPHEDGIHTYISVKFPVYDPRGTVLGVCGISTDIKERKRSEEALRAAHGELEIRVAERTAELVRANEVLQEEIRERQRADERLRESEQRYRELFDNANDIIYTRDLEGRFISINKAAERITGYTRDEILHTNIFEIVAPEHREVLRSLVATNSARGHPSTYTVDLIAKDGRRVPIEVNAILIHKDGSTVGIQGIARDISGRRKAESALRQANEKLEAWVLELERRNREMSLLSELGELLQACLTEAEAHAVFARLAPQLFPTGAGWLGVLRNSSNRVDPVAQWGPEDSALSPFSPDDCWALRRGRVHIMQDARHDLACKHFRSSPPESYVCAPMLAQGQTLGVLHHQASAPGGTHEAAQRLTIAVAEQVAMVLSNIKLHESLRLQSIRDPLTGLFNRRFMEESLDREVRRAMRNGKPLGIIMLDLDHFKIFNDTFGHDAGDAVLREMGTLLQANIRGEDIACRYGGEEFTLILPEGPLEVTRNRAEQMREEIKSLQIVHRNQPLGPITVSLGVAIFPVHGATGESVLRAADRALYRAKAAGRDRVETAH